MAIAIPLAIAATALSAGAAVYQGVQQYKAGKAQAQAAEQNAAFAKDLGEYNAQAAITRSRAEERRYREDHRRRQAIAFTQLASSGVRMAGTPIALLGDAAAEAEENAKLIRYGGQIDATRARIGAGMESREQAFAAGMYRSQANASLLSGFGNAVGAGLTGAGNLYGMGAFQQSSSMTVPSWNPAGSAWYGRGRA